MKAIAKSNIKYNGVWYKTGDTFEVQMNDAEALKGMIDPVPHKSEEVEKKVTPKAEEKAPKNEKGKSEKA